MTAQILASDLGNLIQDSKRKNSELKNAAEKSLQDLKSLSVTSEAQLAADLSRRPHFISPFLIACGTHNAKFASTGISSLQRLGVSHALPKDRVTEVLEALRESVPLSHDVQLKILQALPSLLQNYPKEVRGDALSIVLQTCSALQTAKNYAVSNTAAATLQQLVIAIFDRVASEDERALEIPTTAEVSVEGKSIAVRPASHDAYKVFHDLNLLITGEKPMYIRFSPMPSTATLELVEAVLSNHNKTMSTHFELIHVLRSLLMPTIIRSLSDRLSFPVTLRILRILNILIRNHLATLPSECEIALGLLNHMLDPEASPLWKRALCLEIFRGIYSDSKLVLEIFGQFDEQEGKKNIFGDNLAAFVRLSTEKPAAIGLGQQSTMPHRRTETKESSDQAVAEAGALAGVIGAPVSENNTNGHPPGISMQWSTLKTPCMESLDKSEPPQLPETYVYSLVLTCITNISETLAKFILPLTVHHENRSKKKSRTDDPTKAEEGNVGEGQRSRALSRAQSFRKKAIPVNPLTLTEHSAHAFVQTASSLVTECWPAVLATCSTFLNAALDTDYYRALVRAIQKFTQVAGLLRLSTPRDAFLTTLAKAAVPPSLLHANIPAPRSPLGESEGVFSNGKGLLSVDSLVSQASAASNDKHRRPSQDISVPSMGPRNLLCLRALLNLAIALGPTLQNAWTIVFETLQAADLVLAMSTLPGGMRTPSSSGPRLDGDSALEKVEAETAAVQAAARRLFESTVDYPNDAFVELLQALCTLLNFGSPSESGQRTPTLTGRPQLLHQRRMGSVSNMSFNSEGNARDSMFALNKIGELATFNDSRLALYEPTESGWDVLIAELAKFSANTSRPTSARLVSADILARTAREIAELSMNDDASEQRSEIQARIISALQCQVSGLYRSDSADDSYDDATIKIHQIALEALKAVIEHCGDSLTAGWDAVFDTLASVFLPAVSPPDHNGKTEVASEEIARNQMLPVEVISKSLARSAFGSIQLVCSDFLAVVPTESLSMLLELLLKFCSQREDFNMSLTTITFYWNVSDFLHSRSDLTTLQNIVGQNRQPDETRRAVRQHSASGAPAALWLQVLMNLATITTDGRFELRNSAVQTVQRIFENYADQLSAQTWMLCIRSVLFAMVQSNLAMHKAIRARSAETNDDIAAWNDTTKSVLGTVSVLLVTFLDNVEDPSGLSRVWCDLLVIFREYFECGSHALGCTVFSAMTTVLSRVPNAELLGESTLSKTADLWKEYFGFCDSWAQGHENNQEAFVAYTKAFKAIYNLSGTNLDHSLPSMLVNLEACISTSNMPAYSSDLDHMTALQSEIVNCFSTIQTNGAGLPETVVKMLSRLLILPYTSSAAGTEKNVPTFVALSKAAMTQLQTVTTRHIDNGDIYTTGAFEMALQSLAKPIQEKYIWTREGKPPTLWQKATSTALAILSPGLSYLGSHELPAGTTRAIWSQIVAIAGSITRAQLGSLESTPSIEKEEESDIDAFTRLRKLITVALGTNQVPDALRRTYTRQLFETSIIHEPLVGEIPDLRSAPLEDLYKIRYGQTKDAEPVVRTEMAYVCFSELLSLVSVHNGSAERVKLAQAAAPYVILRAALPLRAYIADHALRGRMPAPASQRRELLFTLEKLRDLKSEPQAIPDAPGVKSMHSKHLHRLFPLLVRAHQVARNDAEMFESLVALTEAVSGGFGVEDE